MCNVSLNLPPKPARVMDEKYVRRFFNCHVFCCCFQEREIKMFFISRIIASCTRESSYLFYVSSPPLFATHQNVFSAHKPKRTKNKFYAYFFFWPKVKLNKNLFCCSFWGFLFLFFCCCCDEVERDELWTVESHKFSFIHITAQSPTHQNITQRSFLFAASKAFTSWSFGSFEMTLSAKNSNGFHVTSKLRNGWKWPAWATKNRNKTIE